MSVAMAAGLVAGCSLLSPPRNPDVSPTLTSATDGRGATFTLQPWPLDNTVAFLCLAQPGDEFTVAHPAPAPAAQCVPMDVEAWGVDLVTARFDVADLPPGLKPAFERVDVALVPRRGRLPRTPVELDRADDRPLADPQRRRAVLMRVVVTGGAGLVGRAIVRLLRDRGDTVVAIVRDPAKAAHLEALGAELVRDDLSNIPRLTGTLQGVDGAVHAAGSYRVGIPKSERPAMWDANVGTTTRFLAGRGGGHHPAPRLRLDAQRPWEHSRAARRRDVSA